MVQATPSLTSSSRRYIRSSSFVMAMLFTVLCGAAATSLGFFINYFTKGHFVHSTESVLDTQIAFVETLGLEQAREKTDGEYILLTAEGGLPDHIETEITVLTEGIIVFEAPERAKHFAAKVHTLENGQRLLVATDITDVSNDFRFMQWLGLGSIVFVMLVVFVSYIISIFVVTGTNNIAGTARDIIKTGDLSRRLEVKSGWDDLSNMAGVLNLLLDRIEMLMQGVKQVSDNIAHDLRRPLTRLRNHIEKLEPTPEHDALIEEVDQLMTTFNALLRISRIEQEKQRSRFSQTELSDILQDVIELYEPVGESRHITIRSELLPYPLHADRDLLFQAFANILDNAIKYTPDNSRVSIVMKQDGGKVSVSIEDGGQGVETSELERIFDRFYRSEEARHSPGNGLGLALVKAVIELHDGDAWAEHAESGLKIITRL